MAVTRISFRDGGARKRVLVAGGAGFLGCHLSDRLIEAGHRVICLDNLSTGQSSNVEHLLGHPHFTFIAHDIVEPIPFMRRVDQIYNLACPASPPSYQKEPIPTLKTNFLGALNLLRFAQSNQARILPSSPCLL